MEARIETPELRMLIDVVIEDAKSIRSRYPHQLLLALADKEVQGVLANRFRSGQVLEDVVALRAQQDTGLIPVCFMFASGSAVRLAGKFILIQLNHRGQVLVIDEEFVPEQPNPVINVRSGQENLPLAVVLSESRRLSQKSNPAISHKRRRLDAEFLNEHRLVSAGTHVPTGGVFDTQTEVHTGVLTNIDLEQAEEGGGTFVMDTDCRIATPTFVDTVHHVVETDETGTIVDQFDDIFLDQGPDQIVTMQDDSEATNFSDFFEHYGRGF